MVRTRVSLITVGDPGRLSGGYLYHRRMSEAAPRHGASLGFVSFPRAPWPLPTAAGPRVGAKLRAQAPDIVVVDSIAVALAAPWLRRWQTPVTAMAHQPPGGIGGSAVRTRIQASLDLNVYRRVEDVMVASALLRDELIGRGINADKIHVVPPGRDVGETPSGSLPDLRAGRKTALLCVANWIPGKGIIELLEAFAPMARDAATLHLVGDERVDARYAGRVRARLRDQALRDRVVAHGAVSANEVARMYAAADVFVLPSIEAYGTVFGEAMAAGLPVVGWGAGNLPHLANDGLEGLIVPPGDIAGLTEAMSTIIADDAMRSRMGAAAKARARGFPTWEETATAFFDRLRRAAAAARTK